MFSKLDLENQGSRSWVRSQFKVTMWVSHPIDSHPFRSMSIGPPFPEIQHFQNSTLKIKGQGHWWGHSLKSQCGSNILSTHFPFAPCQLGIPFLSYDLFKIWPWKSRVKDMGEVTVQSHNVGLTSCRLTSHFVPCQSGIPFLSYDFFKVWPWKSKVMVMGEVDIENHNVGLAYYRLTSFSFHVNWPSHSWDTAFSKFALENQGSRSWVRSQFKVTMWVWHPIDSQNYVESNQICASNRLL